MTDIAIADAIPATLTRVPSSPALDEGLIGSPDRYFNRELSWLAFNERVLEESENPRHPLLERLRFLSISANNLDEFYHGPRRRAEGPGARRRAGAEPGRPGPAEQLARVNDRRQRPDGRPATASGRAMRAELDGEGLVVIDAKDIDRRRARRGSRRSSSQLFPVLTPLAIDPAHPFPFIPNLGFSLALKLKRLSDGKQLYALVPVPTQVARFWELPPGGRRQACAPLPSLESFLVLFLDRLFPGCEVEGQGVFRLIRDSDVEIEEEAEDLVREFEARLKRAPAGLGGAGQDRGLDARGPARTSSLEACTPSRRT